MKRAVFLDRDGVINRHRHPYVMSVDQLEIFPYSAPSIKRLREAGFVIVVISNQQGVGKGVLSIEALGEITASLEVALGRNGAHLDKVSYCTSLESENDPRRKPGNGMLLEARDEFDLDLSQSFVVGDNWSDIEAGAVSGCRTVLVLSGVAQGALETEGWRHPPDAVFPTLAEATDWILDFGS